MIPISVKSFQGCLEKIALSVTRTMHSERENADLQPLSKDRRSISTPQDLPFSKKMTRTNISRSHLEDKRMTHHHLRKNRIRSSYFRY